MKSLSWAASPVILYLTQTHIVNHNPKTLLDTAKRWENPHIRLQAYSQWVSFSTRKLCNITTIAYKLNFLHHTYYTVVIATHRTNWRVRSWFFLSLLLTRAGRKMRLIFIVTQLLWEDIFNTLLSASSSCWNYADFSSTIFHKAHRVWGFCFWLEISLCVCKNIYLFEPRLKHCWIMFFLHAQLYWISLCFKLNMKELKSEAIFSCTAPSQKV